VSSQLQAAVKKAAELAPHPLLRKLEIAAIEIRVYWAALSPADKRVVVVQLVSHFILFLLVVVCWFMNPPVWLRLSLCLLCLIGYASTGQIPFPVSWRWRGMQ
jgi:hypothetical protein